jgi:pyrimidine-nucleoside phosphorylase
MSKKLATGSDAICLDVKFGSGAFFEKPEEARKLAKAMVEIGTLMNRNTKALLTNMDQPLGKAIGNSLEVKEAIATLKGNGPSDLLELCLQAGSLMLVQAQVASNKEEARAKLLKTIEDGSALDKLAAFIKAQHGDESYIYDPSKFPVAKNIIEIKSNKKGYIQRINALGLGEAAMKQGAGRATKEDLIDYDAGIIVEKKCGDYVNKGDVLAYLHTNKDEYSKQVEEIVEAFIIGAEQGEYYPIVYDIVE